MIEQMIETRALNEVRGILKIVSEQREQRTEQRKEQRETVQHLLAGCKMWMDGKA